MASTEPSFRTTAFTEPESFRSAPDSRLDRNDYFDLICRGSYPDPVAMRSRRTRDGWYRTYVQAVIDTDIRDMARIDEPSNLRRLLTLAAASTAQELNAVKTASDLQLHRTTVNRYLGLLETVFLIRFLPAWSRNLTARTVHRRQASQLVA